MAMNSVCLAMNFITSLFSSFFTVVSIVLDLFTYIPQFFNWLSSKRYMRAVLDSENHHILITQSIFGPGMISKTFTRNYFVITKRSAISIWKISKFLDAAKISYQIFETDENQFDEIHIGGQLTNVHTNAYIYQFFPNFYFVDKPCNKEQHEKYFNIHTECIKYSDEFNGFLIEKKDEKSTSTLFPVNKETDYIFLIKLKITNLSINKTVHLIFGGSDIGTSVAVDFFTKNYKDIYKLAKKDQYFIAMQVHKTNQTAAISSIQDFTARMFNL